MFCSCVCETISFDTVNMHFFCKHAENKVPFLLIFFFKIAKVDCKEVLDIICNLESEGQENTAFILCTTYLTHQLQTANVYCSW